MKWTPVHGTTYEFHPFGSVPPDHFCPLCSRTIREHDETTLKLHAAVLHQAFKDAEAEGTTRFERFTTTAGIQAMRITVTRLNPSGGPLFERPKPMPSAASAAEKAAAEVPFRDRLAIKRMEAARQREAEVRETKPTTKAERVNPNPYKLQVGKRDPLPDLGPYKVTVPEGKDDH